MGKGNGNRVKRELITAGRLSECLKRLEKHPGRGAIAWDNIYIVARSAAASRLACACANWSKSRIIRQRLPPWQPLPGKARQEMTSPKSEPLRLAESNEPPDTLTARRAGLALAAPRLPLAAGRGRKAGLYNH